ncbi:MAG: hypothetical protein FJY40_08250 [Betaproteobacteria bacterium]|nr:hypothetical protein [Betaproteobacteria bacterium]
MEITNNKLHPLVATAAVWLIVLSAAGVASLTGFLPKSGTTTTQQPVVTPAASATAAAPGVITLPVLKQETPAAKPAPWPVMKKAAPPALEVRAPQPVREFAKDEFRPATRWSRRFARPSART